MLILRDGKCTASPSNPRATMTDTSLSNGNRLFQHAWLPVHGGKRGFELRCVVYPIWPLPS